MTTLRIHLDEETRDFLYRHGYPNDAFNTYRTPIHPSIAAALPERHNVTNEGELLFDHDTMGHGIPNRNAFQRWDTNSDGLWQVNELRDEILVCLLPLTQYDEGGQQMWQGLYAREVRTQKVYYWIATDGESGAMGVTRIEAIIREV